MMCEVCVEVFCGSVGLWVEGRWSSLLKTLRVPPFFSAVSDLCCKIQPGAGSHSLLLLTVAVGTKRLPPRVVLRRRRQPFDL